MVEEKIKLLHLFHDYYFFCLQLLAVNSQGKSKWSDVVLFSTHPERPGNDPENICQDLARARWLFKSFLHIDILRGPSNYFYGLVP